jgi:hypothetical protein
MEIMPLEYETGVFWDDQFPSSHGYGYLAGPFGYMDAPFALRKLRESQTHASMQSSAQIRQVGSAWSIWVPCRTENGFLITSK